MADAIQLNAFISHLRPRPRDWHKGLSGHVLIIGGHPGFSGAPQLAAMAALRIGAGLVSVATHPDHAAFLTITCPEIMCHAVKDAGTLIPLLEKATVIILGPGLGQSAWSTHLWQAIHKQPVPIVMDADALNLLAKTPQQQSQWILTPHPGEAGRLLNQSTDWIQSNRITAVSMIQKQFGGVCVLKGAGTLVATPEHPPMICHFGNPGMATAGMGDLLSGVIGGLLAQGIPLSDAAKLGVCLHAMAGDRAASAGERGIIATDLLPHLHTLVNELSATE